MVVVQFEFRNIKIFPGKNYCYIAYFPTVWNNDTLMISFMIHNNNNYDDHNKWKKEFSLYVKSNDIRYSRKELAFIPIDFIYNLEFCPLSYDRTAMAKKFQLYF